MADDTEFATPALDVVAVLDADLNQVFPDARPIKGSIREVSKLMEHPVETGATVADHRIITPVEIELACLLTTFEFADVYQQVRDIYLRGDVLTVQTRTSSYENMVVMGMPHEEAPDMQDGVALVVSLREVKYVTPEFTERKIPVTPANPKNSKTVNRGEQRPTEPPAERKSSILGKIGLLK